MTSKSDGDWSKELHYEVKETEIRLKTGSNYPEGGSGEETTIDICPECFTEKLIPWVKSQGGGICCHSHTRPYASKS